MNGTLPASPGPLLKRALACSILLHGVLLGILWWQPPLTGQRLPSVIQIDLDLIQPGPVPAVPKPAPPNNTPRPQPARAKQSPPPVAIKPRPEPVKLQPIALKPPEPAITTPAPTEPVVSVPMEESLYRSIDSSIDTNPSPSSEPAVTAPPSVFPGKVTASSGIDVANVQASYIAALRLQIDRYKKYPTMARRSQQQGVVLLDFVLAADGSLLNCEIARSSGFPLLDRAARKAVANAAPFEPLPGGLDHRPLKCQLPLRFELAR